MEPLLHGQRIDGGIEFAMKNIAEHSRFLSFSLMKIQKACPPPCLSDFVLECCVLSLLLLKRSQLILGPTTTRHLDICSTGPVEGDEEGAKEAKSSEAKVIVAHLFCRTLHSFWPCFHPCPPPPHGRRSALFPLSFVLGCHSRSSSHALTLPCSSYFHSLFASILVNLPSSSTAS